MQTLEFTIMNITLLVDVWPVSHSQPHSHVPISVDNVVLHMSALGECSARHRQLAQLTTLTVCFAVVVVGVAHIHFPCVPRFKGTTTRHIVVVVVVRQTKHQLKIPFMRPTAVNDFVDVNTFPMNILQSAESQCARERKQMFVMFTLCDSRGS